MSTPTFNFGDENNELALIVDSTLFLFNGSKWSATKINEVSLPDTNFAFLKCASLTEIYQDKKSKFTKVFLLTGGYDIKDSSSTKTCFVINIMYNSETKLIDAFLDFKYPDMQTNRFLHSSLNIQNKYIVIIGGKNEKGVLYKNEYLNLTDNKWYEFPQGSEPRSNFSLCTINDNIYLYGGYSDNKGTFTKNGLCECILNLNDISKSEWRNIKLQSDNMPLVCASIMNNNENLLICGGSNGKGLMNGIYEIEFDDEKKNEEIKANKLGELNNTRSSAHLFMKNEYYYLIGGNVKEFAFDEKKTRISNYGEMFTFDLNNNLIQKDLDVLSDNIVQPLLDLGHVLNSYKNEPGFPYSCSIITKELN